MLSVPEFWQRTYMTAIRNGSSSPSAKSIANTAIMAYVDSMESIGRAEMKLAMNMEEIQAVLKAESEADGK